MDFVSAYMLTLAVEMALLSVLLRDRHVAALIVRNAFVANTLTLSFVWFVFPRLGIFGKGLYRHLPLVGYGPARSPGQ